MLRLFAAIAVPDDIAEGLTDRQHGLDVRWSPPENLHITLRFFGEVAEPVADDLDSELDRIAAAPFALSLAGAGAFGEGEHVGSVWAGVAPNPSLARLAKACETAARRAGLKPETRAYHPHVTLAYVRRADPAAVGAWIQANNLLQSPDFPVTAFGLYSSHATHHGSRYRLERVYPLRG